MTLWFAMSFGFFSRSAASVKWNSAKLRIIEFAEMIAIFAVVGALWRVRGAVLLGDVMLVLCQNVARRRRLNSESRYLTSTGT
jgi:hypothetical protein